MTLLLENNNIELVTISSVKSNVNSKKRNPTVLEYLKNFFVGQKCITFDQKNKAKIFSEYKIFEDSLTITQNEYKCKKCIRIDLKSKAKVFSEYEIINDNLVIIPNEYKCKSERFTRFDLKNKKYQTKILPAEHVFITIL
jgi:hypothetical protein